MKPLVIGVSAILPLAFPDEEQRYAERVLDELGRVGGAVPSIFWYELWNVLWTNMAKRNRIDWEKAIDFLAAVDSFRLVTAPLADPRALLDLAVATRVTAYDAAYLELARRDGLRLATLDAGLISAAKSSGLVDIYSDA
ncbi:type II toxin-antitoxin system VapC family toxin [Botrimarina sp.]|uniref:type II toxin-antitoxin system VapC family toxin n=1 Tax=Botrimarina sp. TaxID=2795802 RepID=UPI0032EBB9FF